jgi:hypothetical protein
VHACVCMCAGRWKAVEKGGACVQGVGSMCAWVEGVGSLCAYVEGVGSLYMHVCVCVQGVGSLCMRVYANVCVRVCAWFV